MNVLRVGGEYLHEQESRGWRALAMITVALLLAAIVGVLGQRSSAIVRFLALAITVGLLVHAGRALRTVLRRLRATRKGRLGEQLTTQLVSRLSDDYYLINDLVLARGNIDHVLVGPTGILVVETKRVAGEIACHGDWWTVNGRPVKSYSKQAKAGALAVKTFLATHHPELRQSIARALVPAAAGRGLSAGRVSANR